MAEDKLTVAKQVTIKSIINAEAKDIVQRIRVSNLQTLCVYMAVTFIDENGHQHIMSGGQVPEPEAKFLRRLMLMHARATGGGDDVP